MTPCVAVFATEDLSLVIGTNMVEGNNRLLQVIQCLYMRTVACMYLQVHVYK